MFEYLYKIVFIFSALWPLTGSVIIITLLIKLGIDKGSKHAIFWLVASIFFIIFSTYLFVTQMMGTNHEWFLYVNSLAGIGSSYKMYQQLKKKQRFKPRIKK